MRWIFWYHSKKRDERRNGPLEWLEGSQKTEDAGPSGNMETFLNGDKVNGYTRYYFTYLRKLNGMHLNKAALLPRSWIRSHGYGGVGGHLKPPTMTDSDLYAGALKHWADENWIKRKLNQDFISFPFLFFFSCFTRLRKMIIVFFYT